MNIALPVEWISRELDSKLLLICHLIKNSKKKKIKIFFGDQKLLGKFLSSKKFSPFVWISSGVDQQLSAYLNLLKIEGLFTSLDEEGGIFTKYEEEYYPRHLRGRDNSHFISKLFIWGKKEYFKFKKDFNLISKNALILSGNPRFDLANKKYKNFHFSKNKKVNVLINSAFGTGNSDINIKDEKLYWMSRADNFDFKKSFDFLDPIYTYQKKNFLPFLEDIKKLALKYPKLTFGIRCHPAENKQVYKIFFKKIKNFKVLDNSESALYNIFNSDILIHNGCTTAIENTISNKISICHINHRNKKFEQYLPVKISYNSSNFFQLEKIFRDCIKKKSYDRSKYLKILKYLKNYISQLNKSSSDVISKNLLNIKLQDELKIKKEFIVENKDKNKKKDWFFLLKRKLIQIFFYKKIILTKKKINERQKRKFFSIPKVVIVKKLNELLKINKCSNNYKISLLKKNLFLIENN